MVYAEMLWQNLVSLKMHAVDSWYQAGNSNLPAKSCLHSFKQELDSCTFYTYQRGGATNFIEPRIT